MVSTRGTALLVTADQTMEQWMTECATSMGFGHIAIRKPGDLAGIDAEVSLCLVDLAGLEGVGWGELLSRTRERHPLVPGVLVSAEPNPAVPQEALGAGIVDLWSRTESVSELAARFERVIRRTEAVRDIRRGMDGLAKLSGKAEREVAEGGSAAESRAGRAVLLVGGEDSLGQAAQALENADMEVSRASSMGEARKAVQDKSFQVLVVDNDLPDASGLEAMRELAGTQSDARILFVVGFTAADDAVQALRWGAASFLIKPIGVDQLVEQVTVLMGTEAQSSGVPGGEQAGEAVRLLEDAIHRLCTV